MGTVCRSGDRCHPESHGCNQYDLSPDSDRTLLAGFTSTRCDDWLFELRSVVSHVAKRTDVETVWHRSAKRVGFRVGHRVVRRLRRTHAAVTRIALRRRSRILRFVPDPPRAGRITHVVYQIHIRGVLRGTDYAMLSHRATFSTSEVEGDRNTRRGNTVLFIPCLPRFGRCYFYTPIRLPVWHYIRVLSSHMAISPRPCTLQYSTRFSGRTVLTPRRCLRFVEVGIQRFERTFIFSSPRTIVAIARLLTFQPWNGLLRLFV